MQQPHVQPKKWEWQDCRAKIKTNNLYDQPSANGNDNEGSRPTNGHGYRNPEEENHYSLFNLDPSIVLTNPLKNGVSLSLPIPLVKFLTLILTSKENALESLFEL